jgi:hypothetical protein
MVLARMLQLAQSSSSDDWLLDRSARASGAGTSNAGSISATARASEAAALVVRGQGLAVLVARLLHQADATFVSGS